MIEQLTRRRARLARYYLQLAESHFRYSEESSLFAGINILHEALETALITAADVTGASVSQRETVEGYLDKIGAKAAQPLPLRHEVLRFNRARVSAKHALTLPSERDARDFFSTIPAFCREIFQIACGLDLLQASLIDLIEDKEIREHLSNAEKLIVEGLYFKSLIETRKAFYLKFLKQFDIRPFEGKKDGESYGMLDERSLCRAPYYAKSDRYIRKNVTTPLDYIVIDHSYLDSECLKAGVRPNDFWNVWRLTPGIIQTNDGNWLVKRTARLQEDTEKENAQYALDTLVDIILSIQASNQKAKYRPSNDLWMIEAKPGTKIYTKCTRKSEVSYVVGEEGAYLSTSEANPAFDEKAYFWSVMHFRKGGPFYGGHLHEEDFDGTLHPFDAEKLGIEQK